MLTISDFESAYQDHVPIPQEIPRHFATLVPLVEQDGVVKLLFEVRARNMRNQPGEICFPGGRMERGEGVVEAALRETWEELGIPVSAIRPIAELNWIVMSGSFTMHPVLAQVDEAALEHLRLNPAEVEEVFLAPVDFFRTNPAVEYMCDLAPTAPADFPNALVGYPDGYPWHHGKNNVPLYPAWEGKVVWGLTGRVLRELLRGLPER